MLRDVLTALGAARLDRVWVVTRDAEVAAAAGALGAEPLAPPTPAENASHTAAIAFAQAEAGRRGARVFLTVPGDVPCATAAELAELAAAARPGAPAFAPSRSGLGANRVPLAPPDAVPLPLRQPAFAGPRRRARGGAALAGGRGAGPRPGARPAPGRADPPRVAPRGPHGPGRPDHRDAPRLGLRQRRRGPVQRRARLRGATAAGPRPLGAPAPRAAPRPGGGRGGPPWCR